MRGIGWWCCRECSGCGHDGVEKGQAQMRAIPGFCPSSTLLIFVVFSRLVSVVCSRAIFHTCLPLIAARDRLLHGSRRLLWRAGYAAHWCAAAAPRAGARWAASAWTTAAALVQRHRQERVPALAPALPRPLTWCCVQCGPIACATGASPAGTATCVKPSHRPVVASQRSCLSRASLPPSPQRKVV